MTIRTIYISIGLLFLNACQPAVRSHAQAVDEALITDEIQESTLRKPYYVPADTASAFREKYRALYQHEPNLVGQQANQSVFLLYAAEIKDAAFADFKIQEMGKRPPFVYFDTSYATRLERGYRSHADLISGYKDPSLNEALLSGVVTAHPGIARLHVIGTTTLGRNILALQIQNFKSSNKKIAVLFTGATHANELTATEHCYDIIYRLVASPSNYTDVLDNIDIWVVPIVNPDGSQYFWHRSTAMGRKNASLAPGQNADSLMRGTDLNRNYPFRWNSGNAKASSDNPESVYYRGHSPGSEPETRAIINLAERERFVYAISFHAVSGKILIPYTIDNLKNPSPDYASALARELVPITRHHNKKRGFRAVKKIYSVDGTDQDFLYFKFGTLAYIIESSYRNCDYQYVNYYIEGYRPLWEAFLRNYSANLKIALQVTNEKGEPILASVTFSDLRLFESEVRTTNPRDGTFYRLTKDPATVGVTVTAQGYAKKTVQIAPQGPGYPGLVLIVLTRNAS